MAITPNQSRLPIGEAGRAPDTLRKLVSSGGVLYRYSYQGELEFVLVGRRQPSLWALPKGTPRVGETLEQTALREVEEETGVLGQIVASLGSITYSFTTPPRGTPAGRGANGSVRYEKTVHHFLLRPVAGDPALHDAEYDLVRWLPALDALARLSHENERSVLRRAIRFLDRPGAETKTVRPR